MALGWYNIFMVDKKPPKTTKKPLNYKNPTIKQRKYVKNVIVKGLSKYQSAVKAGYSPNTARNLQKTIESKPAVKRTMAEALEKAGLTTDYMVRHIKSGMRSKKALVVKDKIEYVYDKSTQHRYLETSLRLAGYGSDTHININVDNRKAYVTMPENPDIIGQTISSVPAPTPKKDK